MKRIVFIMVCVLILSGSKDPNQWKNIDYIQKAFTEVALKDKDKKSDMAVTKWSMPIRYTVIYQHIVPYHPFDDMVNVHFKQLKHITQHAITKAEDNKQANVKIIVTKEPFYQETLNQFSSSKSNKLPIDSNCSASINWDKHHSIYQATVIIPIDYAITKRALPSLITGSLTKIMGLKNDSNWVYPSITNDISKVELLTGLDYILLKLLYSNNIKIGMTSQNTQGAIHQLLLDFQAQNIIKQATRKVRQEGLYPYLY